MGGGRGMYIHSNVYYGAHTHERSHISCWYWHTHDGLSGEKSSLRTLSCMLARGRWTQATASLCPRSPQGRGSLHLVGSLHTQRVLANLYTVLGCHLHDGQQVILRILQQIQELCLHCLQNNTQHGHIQIHHFILNLTSKNAQTFTSFQYGLWLAIPSGISDILFMKFAPQTPPVAKETVSGTHHISLLAPVAPIAWAG